MTVTEQQTWAALGVLCATLLASMTIVSTMFVRFINAKFQIVDARFEAVDARFAAMDTKFEAKFETFEAKLDAVSASLSNLDRDVQMLVHREMDR